MTEQEIIENNNLIDKFMPDYLFEGNDNYYLETAKYHSSFDWIMPVTERITSLGFQVQLLSFKEFGIVKRKTLNGFRINDGKTIISFSENTDMKTAIYESVVKFIKYYNDK